MLRTRVDFDASRVPFASGLELRGPDALRAASIHARLEAVSLPFRARVWTAKVGSVRLTRYEGDALVSERSVEMVNDAYRGFVQLGFPMSGWTRIEQDGRDVTVRVGQAALVRQDRPFRLENSDGYASVQLYLEARHLLAWGQPETTLVASSWDLSPRAGLARDFISQISVTGEDSGPRDRHLAMALGHAAMSILADREPRTESGEYDGLAAVRLRALGIIDARFADPSLTVAAMAEALSVSRRVLYRAFEGSGTQVAALLRERRLDHASELLSHPRAVEMTLAGIAHTCGFSGASSFARAFQQRFGCTPGDYRSLRRD